MDENFGGAAFFLPSTSTPQPKDMSEIGSTDGIVIMGILIALIVIIPILWRRKTWMEPR
jgi:membrane protein YdbS with pleckstrin-like domain